MYPPTHTAGDVRVPRAAFRDAPAAPLAAGCMQTLARQEWREPPRARNAWQNTHHPDEKRKEDSPASARGGRERACRPRTRPTYVRTRAHAIERRQRIDGSE